MEVKLESLIAKIKKDGIEEAKKKAGEIIGKAKQEAETIIKAAKEEALRLEKEAKVSAAKLEIKAKDSLKQAARDLSLALKGELVAIFSRILKDRTADALTPGFMGEIILKIIDKFSTGNELVWEILVNKADKEKLEKLLLASFKSEAKKTIEVKVSKAIDKGFHIGIKGEDVHYDFTEQSILEALGEFLNPSLWAILNTNNG
ncbi:MAG: hypothetical protein ABIE75_04610 [Candidatus Omnitrophota bacterium]